MTEKLLPCHFCGKNDLYIAKELITHNHSVYTICHEFSKSGDCRVAITGSTHEEAIRRWNKRLVPTLVDIFVMGSNP